VMTGTTQRCALVTHFVGRLVALPLPGADAVSPVPV
jgi:hypothetical protein